MRNDGYALAKKLEEERLEREKSYQALMNVSDSVFTVAGMPYCWPCSQKRRKKNPIKVEMMGEQVVDGIHYLIIRCHGHEDRMRVTNKELLDSQNSGGSLSPSWAFKPEETKTITDNGGSVLQ